IRHRCECAHVRTEPSLVREHERRHVRRRLRRVRPPPAHRIAQRTPLQPRNDGALLRESSMRHYRLLVSDAQFLGALALMKVDPAHAQSVTLPQNGTVTAGAASVSSPSANTLNINQSSSQAIINWQSFSVGKGGTVNFNQPGASSSTLNRVTSSTP